MLRNRLAELLSERQLKITQVAKDTGISRNTITATAQNDSKMIQYKTIDVLCQYLNVTPDTFFEYIPFDYSFYHENLDIGIRSMDYDENIRLISEILYCFDFFVDVKGENNVHSFSLNGEVVVVLEGKHTEDFINNFEMNVFFDDKSTIDLFNEFFYEKLSAGFKTIFDKEVREFLIQEFYTDFTDNYPTGSIDGLYEGNDVFDIWLPWSNTPF